MKKQTANKLQCIQNKNENVAINTVLKKPHLPLKIAPNLVVFYVSQRLVSMVINFVVMYVGIPKVKRK